LPAPNAYNITETPEHLETRLNKFGEKKLKRSDRLSFLDTLELESTKVPGPGSYNLHVPLSRM
jgi:hypothetical protein